MPETLPNGRKGRSGSATRGATDVSAGVAPMVFCGNCGVALTGARYCQSCGSPTALAGVPQQSSPPASEFAAKTSPTAGITGTPLMSAGPYYASVPTEQGNGSANSRSSRAAMIVAGAVVVVVLIAAAAAVFVLRSRGKDDSFPAQARAALTPVAADNQAMTQAVAGLRASKPDSAAKRTVARAGSDVQTAQAGLAALNPATEADRTASAKARTALSAEAAWLTAASAVLRDPSSAQISQLSSLGDAAKAALANVTSVPGIASFPTSTTLVDYAQTTTQAKTTRASLSQFSQQVMQLLEQSSAAFTQVNQLYQQMSQIAAGDGGSLTIAQAEQTISTVVSNREGLAASARALNAPTATARSVRDALATAMDDSLADDQAIDNCLNEDNFGDIAFLYQSCLQSTSTASQTATSAKNQFYDAYNALRAKLGEPATHAAF